MNSNYDNHGHKSEKILETVCARIFGPDLVSRNPMVYEPSGPKELADVIILVEDTLVAIQSKSINLNAADIDDIKLGRVNKKIEQAKAQLQTSVNAQTRNAQIKAQNCIGIEIDVDWSSIRRQLGIVTINIQDSAFEDPEFRFSFPILVEKLKQLEVHIFILRDLFHISEYIDTPSDFLYYLKDRNIAHQCHKLIAGNELDFMAFLKTHYDWFEQLMNGTHEADHILIQPGLWEEFIKYPQVIEMREYNKKHSKIIDIFISEIKNTIQMAIETDQANEDEAGKNYFMIVSALSKMRRIERREVGKKILEKREKTKNQEISHFIHIMPDENLAFLFIACNQEDRELRKNVLMNISVSAAHVVPVTRLIGVITEGVKARGFSLDLLYAETSELKKNELLIPPEKIFGKMQNSHIHEWDKPSS